jgi:hypothetical protein
MGAPIDPVNTMLRVLPMSPIVVQDGARQIRLRRRDHFVMEYGARKGRP